MAKEIELPAGTLEDIREAESRIKLLQSFIDKARSAGIGVDTFNTQLGEQKQKLSRIRTAFYPTQP
jgi:hypothetical protein